MKLSNSNRTRFGTLLVLASTLNYSHSWAPTNHRQIYRYVVVSRNIDTSSSRPFYYDDISQHHEDHPSNICFRMGGRLFSSLSVQPESRQLDVDGKDGFDIVNKNSTLAMKRVLPKTTQIEIVKDNDPVKDGEQHQRQKQQQQHQKRKQQHRQKDKQIVQIKFCPFTSYLFKIKSTIMNRRDVAKRLDDEVKRMESLYYGLMEDYLPQENPSPGGMDGLTYKGIIVRPTEAMYRLVCATYCRAWLGTREAQAVENAIARYEKFNPGEHASSKMMGYAMKASIRVQDLDRAEYWLRRIEAKYQMSHDGADIPGDAVYGPFVKGLLADTRPSRGRICADMSIEIIHKMNQLYGSTKKVFCHPSQEIYSAAIKCQPHGYSGMEALERMEGLFGELLKAYKDHKHPLMKPTAKVAHPLFAAALHCYGLDRSKAAKIGEKIMNELQQLYSETGDIDFCPSALMYRSMFTMYMRMNSPKRPNEYADKVGFLVESLKATGVVVEPRIVLGALNRLLHAADALIPNDPLEDPVKTKFYFDKILVTFKMFHGENPIAPPNTSTYEIFLRACNRLPQGEARLKLAAKAFTLCRKNGLVTSRVCRLLHGANPRWAVSELNTKGESIKQNLFVIPDSWKNSVLEEGKIEMKENEKKGV